MSTYALSTADIRLPKHTLCSINEFPRRRIDDNIDVTANSMVSVLSISALLFRNIITGKRNKPCFVKPLGSEATLLGPLSIQY